MTRCPQLPTSGDTRPPAEKAGLAEDIEVIRAAAKELIDASHPVIVLAHSYGGTVACGAITPDLYAFPETSGDSALGPGIVQLVFVSCWLPLPSKTVLDIIEKHGFQCDVDLGYAEEGSVAFAKNPAEAFFSDIFETDPDEARALAEKCNTTFNWKGAGVSVEGAPWRDVPCIYVYLKRDRCIYLPLQRAMVEDLVGVGGRFESAELDTGHCPFFSQPEQVVGLVQGIWESRQV